MPKIDKWTKQPADVEDYDVSYVDYLEARGDTGDIHTVVAEPGITVVLSTLVAGVVKVWLSGGTDKEDYKITVTLETTGGRTKQVEFVVRVRES